MVGCHNIAYLNFGDIDSLFFKSDSPGVGRHETLRVLWYQLWCDWLGTFSCRNSCLLWDTCNKMMHDTPAYDPLYSRRVHFVRKKKSYLKCCFKVLKRRWRKQPDESEEEKDKSPTPRQSKWSFVHPTNSSVMSRVLVERSKRRRAPEHWLNTSYWWQCCVVQPSYVGIDAYF